MTAREKFQEWVKALRSGEYSQGGGQLTALSPDADKGTTHCCLGVYCHLDAERGVLMKHSIGPSIHYQFLRGSRPSMSGTWSDYSYTELLRDGTLSYPVNDVMKFHLDALSPELRAKIDNKTTNWKEEGYSSLVTLNDRLIPFNDIADVIEEIWLKEDY